MTMMSGTKASRRLEDTRKTRILMTHTLAETRRREDHAALMFPRRQKKAKKVLKKCPSLVHFLKKSWRNTWSFAAAVLAPRQWISYPRVIQTFRSSVHIFRHPLFQ